jgi:para-nitrobenzyl esterase
MVVMVRLFAIGVIVLATGCDSSTVMVHSPAGSIEGTERDGVQRFLGIPYAEPPSGDRRWRPPEPKAQFHDVFTANEFAPWCAQFDFDRRDEGNVDAGEGWTLLRDVPPNPASREDCLTLNVFAPVPNGEARPVLVFLHGNALGASFPMYDGSAMARSGVVFVSVDFRLLTMGIFTHPALAAEESPGRFSELDRLEALRWVQRNVGAFGGDPGQVTLAGSSEGGAAILQLLTNPAAEGLFHRAIVQSGNGWWQPLTPGQHEALGCRLATLAGLNGCEATAEELRALPWHALPGAGPYTAERGSVGATQAIAAGHAIDVPLLIGWNDFDGSSLRYTAREVVDHTHPDVLASYDTTQPLEDLAYALYTDLHAGAPARWIAHRLEDGHPVYLYLYSYVMSWDRGDVRGAQHVYELPHVLDTWAQTLDDRFPLLSTLLLEDEDEAMSRLMHECWVAFVKHGVPACSGAPAWPPYQRETDPLMQLDLPPRIVRGYRATQLDAQEAHMDHYLKQVAASLENLLDRRH